MARLHITIEQDSGVYSRTLVHTHKLYEGYCYGALYREDQSVSVRYSSKVARRTERNQHFKPPKSLERVISG